jgi:hypothetical protein
MLLAHQLRLFFYVKNIWKIIFFSNIIGGEFQVEQRWLYGKKHVWCWCCGYRALLVKVTGRLKVFRKDCKAKLEKFYMNITLCLRHDLSLSWNYRAVCFVLPQRHDVHESILAFEAYNRFFMAEHFSLEKLFESTSSSYIIYNNDDEIFIWSHLERQVPG